MRIIDFRCRPNTAEYLSAFSDSAATVTGKLGESRSEASTLEAWVASFESQGVERVVFTGRQLLGHGGYDVGNDYIADVMGRFPGKVVGFAGIDPLNGMRSVRAVDHAIRNLGLKGISIEPFSRQVAANDRRLYPVYTKCAELGVPVVVTCGPLPFPGPRISQGDVRAIDDVATDFPELTIVIDHSGWPWVTETIAIVYRHENVYIDTSLYSHFPGAELFADAANTIIKDRILFASAFPTVPLDKALKNVRKLPFSPEALEGVLYGNAQKLLARLGC